VSTRPERPRPEFLAGQTVNLEPKPRVLITGYFTKENADLITESVQQIAPTVRYSQSIDRVDLSEFDCVITDATYAYLRQIDHSDSDDGFRRTVEPPTYWKWEQSFPPHISIIYIHTASGNSSEVLDFSPPKGESEDIPSNAILADVASFGSYVTYVSNLPGHIDDLVKRYMAPKAQQREQHITFRKVVEAGTSNDVLPIRPLLLGPSNQILALTYERSAEASVWVLPADLLGKLQPWVTAALREWHGLYPKRFPAVPDWQSQLTWSTPAEHAVAQRQGQLVATFEAAKKLHEQQMEAASQELESVRTAAASYEKTLLTGTGTELESAIARALRELGFDVQDMDPLWPPDAKREDFRVTDPDSPGWLALAEAKGFTKGVAEVGLTSLGRWVEFFIQETGVMPSARWYIANHHLREDPSNRPVGLHGRDDVIEVFRSSNGLLIDTRVLFRMLTACQETPAVKPTVRAHLRASFGRLDLEATETFLSEL